MNEQAKFSIDYSLKFITISAFVFLIMNFIFNLGYFSCMGIRYASLLEIKDYYEGTAPLLTFVVAIFLTLTNALIFSNFVKNIIMVIDNYINLFCIKCRFKISVILKYRLVPYKMKREFVRLKKDLNVINKKFFKYTFLDLCNFIFFASLLTMLIFQLYDYVYKLSKSSFWILLVLYLLCNYISIFVKDLIAKITAIIMIMTIMVALLGHWAFLRDLNNAGTNVILDNNNQVSLVRPIAKGVIVKNKSDIEFYQWNRVKKFSKPIKVLKVPDILLSK